MPGVRYGTNMNKTKQVTTMSLSALRPNLYRVVPRLAERQEEIHITHHGHVIAVLSPAPERPPAPCTGLTATWCPNCGSCTCPPHPDPQHFNADCCPLHSSDSRHGESDTEVWEKFIAEENGGEPWPPRSEEAL